jgi:site-specific DNA-methyltransferase (adenine-specific)
MYPQHFFNEEQNRRRAEKKMRFIPGPSSVIEESLLVGFVGKNEQTGHKSQKPEKVYDKLLLMVTQENDLVYDPMCGSGTTGASAKKINRKCILSDMSEEYVKMAEKRLGIKRVPAKMVRAVMAA